jgi:hypothetical protein
MEVVEASGPDVAAAERNAVASLFSLYLSSAEVSGSRAVLEEKVLARAPAFIRKREVLRRSGPGTSIRALVRVGSLGEEISRLGLDSGLGLKGRAKVLVALSEDGRACRDAGCASEALRRALVRRGFSAYDLSDRVNPLSAGSPPRDPRAAARTLGADIIVTGSARVEAVEDGRLTGPEGSGQGYQVGKAVLELSAELLNGSGEALPVRVEASAVDLSAASAFAKALDNAGEMAGDAVAEKAAKGWKVDSELSLVVVGLRDLEAGRRLIDDLRTLPGLSGVGLASYSPPETRLKVRTGLAADGLASAVVGMRSYGFNILAVGSDLVELEVLRDKDDERERELF